MNPETPFFIEFPSGPLAIGDEPPSEISSLRFSTGNLRLLSPTDSVKDRLAAYYHWKDKQSLEQAILIARNHTIGQGILGTGREFWGQAGNSGDRGILGTGEFWGQGNSGDRGILGTGEFWGQYI